jgi:hypothetical protein
VAGVVLYSLLIALLSLFMETSTAALRSFLKWTGNKKNKKFKKTGGGV